MDSTWQDILDRAHQTYVQIQEDGNEPDDPADLFAMAYALGVAYGLALASVRPDMTERLEPQFRERGWLRVQPRDAGT